jgi:hypothetical protein
MLKIAGLLPVDLICMPLLVHHDGGGDCRDLLGKLVVWAITWPDVASGRCAGNGVRACGARRLGGQATAQADNGYGQAGHRDYRAAHRPEGVAGHGASADDANTLEREDDPCQCDENSYAGEDDRLDDGCLFPGPLDVALCMPSSLGRPGRATVLKGRAPRCRRGGARSGAHG